MLRACWTNAFARCCERLEREDAEERAQGLPGRARARQVARDDRPVPLRARLAAGRLRGARDRRLARLLDDLARRRRPTPRRTGRSRSRTIPLKAEAWRRNIAEAGLEEWAELVEGDALETLQRSTTCSTSSSSTPRRTTTSSSSRSPARKVEPGGARSSPTTCSRTPSRSRPTPPRARRTRRSSSVTVPLDRGLELSVSLALTSGPLLCELPRKGGGPVVNSDSSTGSGGTSG